MSEIVESGKRGASPLSADEENVMQMTFKAAMLRAADIVERITEADVLEMQAQLLAAGSSLEKVARCDRAMLAVAHLRACANGTAKGEMRAISTSGNARVDSAAGLGGLDERSCRDD